MNIVEGQVEREVGRFKVFVSRRGGVAPPIDARADDTLRDVLGRAGVTEDADLVTFFPKDQHEEEADDADDLEHDQSNLDRTLSQLGIGRGARIVCSCCRWVEVSIQYQAEAADHRFRPSARVRRVLRWARNHWNLNAEDFETIKLRLCGTTDDLLESTRLAELLTGSECALCMELVPSPKVNG